MVGEPTSSRVPHDRKQTIVVELENSIFKQGLMAEGLWALVRSNPFNLVKMVVWALQGELETKVRRALNNCQALPPLQPEVIALLKAKQAEGYPIILKHRRLRELAHNLQSELGCFADLTNHIPEHLESEGFTLVTSSPETDIWHKAQSGVFCGDPAVWQKLCARHNFEIKNVVGGNQRRLPLALLKALRPHQWLKSVLVFVPLFLGAGFLDFSQWLACLALFVCFAAVASSTYIINDLFDLDADRSHQENRKRPFASGDLPLYWGPIMYGVLLTAGLLGGLAISQDVFWVLLAYSGIGHMYTFYLKRLAVIDAFILSGLYCGRVFAGAVAIEAEVSAWFYLASGFFFLSLAFMKRVSELKALKGSQRVKRRGYVGDDAAPLMVMGVGAAMLFAVFYPLFLHFQGLMNHPSLWLIEVVVLYWFCHIWLLTWQQKMAADPVKFALTDWVSQICFGVIAALWLLPFPWL